MNTLGVRETMQQNLPKWASITQAYQFAKTGKAEPNFATLSKLTHCGIPSRRLQPLKTFDPLRQPPWCWRLAHRIDAPSSIFSKDRNPTEGSRGTAVLSKPGVDAWRTFQRSGSRSG